MSMAATGIVTMIVIDSIASRANVGTVANKANAAIRLSTEESSGLLIV
jgi:hypothetical protein